MKVSAIVIAIVNIFLKKPIWSSLNDLRVDISFKINVKEVVYRDYPESAQISVLASA